MCGYFSCYISRPISPLFDSVKTLEIFLWRYLACLNDFLVRAIVKYWFQVTLCDVTADYGTKTNDILSINDNEDDNDCVSGQVYST